MKNCDLHSKMTEQTKGCIKPYRVLSLDGGGMRGLYTASVLQSLVNRFSGVNSENKDIGKGFDLIVGTSTGGILACGLAAGIPINKIVDLYSKKGNRIFTDPFPFEGHLKKYWWIFKNRKKAANSNSALKQELKSIFSNKTFGQIYKDRQIGLCITAVNLIDHSPRVFKTPHDPSKNMDNNRRLTDVCLASSAAPILFPIAHIPDPERSNIYEDFVDGGLWANSPILVALVEAITCSKKEQPVEIVSVGSCSPPPGQTILEKDINKGFIGWRAGIGPMELSMDAQSKSSHFISGFLCAQLEKFGKPIKICHLKQRSPSAEQIKFLSMDQADEQTCSMLIKWGSKDAAEIYGEIIRENKHSILKTIFNNLPNLKGGNNYG